MNANENANENASENASESYEKAGQIDFGFDNVHVVLKELKCFYQRWFEFQDAYDLLKDLLTEEKKITDDNLCIEQARNLMDFNNRMSN